jgi:hypothetical protein
MANDVWFSDRVDPAKLLCEIDTCPELVVIHPGNRKNSRSLRSVMDDHQAIRLYTTGRRSPILVKRNGRSISAKMCVINRRQRSSA